MADTHSKPRPYRIKDLQGQRFGRLVVKRFLYTRGHEATYWLCVCDCGTEKAVRAGNLRSGNTKSCGCRQGTYRHDKYRSKVYLAWGGMLQRCENPKDPSYRNYGGRGITVCEQWHDFVVFYADMGDPPTGLSLDRIDNDGNYEPENCRWASLSEQQRNCRHNHLVTFQGKTQCLAAWAQEVSINQSTIQRRLHRGWSVRRALTPRT